jgi:secondary thiamine-phosphate synthase enzyme
VKSVQRQVTLPAFPRGFHLITRHVVEALPEIGAIESGILQVFILHTSASLTVNENADPTVREDFEAYFNRAVPEEEPYYRHTAEGPDDMPAHIKASMMGSSVSIPITSGRPNLGTWQGIYLCEHRDRGGPRRLVVTAVGD